MPTDLSFGGQFDPSPVDGRHKLSLPAMIYLVAVVAAAGLATLPLIGRLQSDHHSPSVWATFVILAAGAAIAQVLLVEHPPNQTYHATNVFLIPAILLLPPELVVAVTIIMHIPSWLKTRTWHHFHFPNPSGKAGAGFKAGPRLPRTGDARSPRRPYVERGTTFLCGSLNGTGENQHAVRASDHE